MTEHKIGSYFLGKAINGRDYVWGRILAPEGEKFVAGFFPWSPDTSETDAIRQTVTPDQMTGWQFHPTAQALNDAVADLARSLATVAQYDRPKPAVKKKSKKAANSVEKKDAI
jgi:hypothetical protein